MFGTIINDGEDVGPPRMEALQYEGGANRNPTPNFAGNTSRSKNRQQSSLSSPGNKY